MQSARGDPSHCRRRRKQSRRPLARAASVRRAGRIQIRHSSRRAGRARPSGCPAAARADAARGARSPGRGRAAHGPLARATPRAGRADVLFLRALRWDDAGDGESGSALRGGAQTRGRRRRRRAPSHLGQLPQWGPARAQGRYAGGILRHPHDRRPGQHRRSDDHLQRRRRGCPGIRRDRRVVLFAPPDFGTARRRGSLRRRRGDPGRGLSIRLRANSALHLGHDGGPPAPGLRLPPERTRRARAHPAAETVRGPGSSRRIRSPSACRRAERTGFGRARSAFGAQDCGAVRNVQGAGLEGSTDLRCPGGGGQGADVASGCCRADSRAGRGRCQQGRRGCRCDRSERGSRRSRTRICARGRSRSG